MKRLSLALVPAVLALALVGAAPPRSHAGPLRVASPLAPVLGIAYRPSAYEQSGYLAWFHPTSLTTLRGRKAPLGDHVGSWAFSSDRSVLATASCEGLAGIRFVNARSMRVLGDVRLATNFDCADSLTWLRPNRLLAVVRLTSSTDAAVAVIDPVARRVLRYTSLPNAPWAMGRTHDELVLLFAGEGSFVPARVAAVDPEGNVRTVTVDRVLAGTIVDQTGQDYHARTISPGFAVDPDGRRAFVVSTAGPIAEIDLRTLEMSYHDLDQPSLLHRVMRWLTPDAAAKEMEGPTRAARWLGDGILVTSGVDYAVGQDANGNAFMVGSPIGVRLVDTRTWHTRMLSAGSSDFAATSDVVVAEGGLWDSRAQQLESPGLLAFGRDGRERWRMHSGQDSWITPAGSVGYIELGEGRMQVVDLSTGHTIRTLRRDEQLEPWPQLLVGPADG